MLKLRTIEEKKDTELILHVWFSKSNFFEEIDDVKRMLNASGVTGAGRKEGLDNADWSGRSYIVLLVVFVLNVDDGRMNGLSIEFFFSVFIFLTICLESGNAEFVFSEEIIRKPENSFDDALSLLQRLMADFRSSKRT